MRTRKMSGFTLIELLVVIAIIGVLVSLLLPAVQAAREHARRFRCSNNLKQIGTALHGYHSQFKTFPINYGVAPRRGVPDSLRNSSKGKSWLIGLLPFIEEQRLHDTVRFDQALSHINNTTVAKTVIPLYLCPTDRDEPMRDDRALAGRWAVTNYNAVCGSNWELASFPEFEGLYKDDEDNDEPLVPRKFGYGRYKNREDGLDRGNGFICRGAQFPYEEPVTAIRDITDGTSNVLAIGEVVPRYCEKVWWYWFDGAVATAIMPINYRPDDDDPQLGDWERTYGFHSRHGAGANFCLADGSVRWVDESINLLVYHHLAQISSGVYATFDSDEIVLSLFDRKFNQSELGNAEN